MERRLLAAALVLGLGVAVLLGIRGGPASDPGEEVDRLVAEARVLFEEKADIDGTLALLDQAIVLKPDMHVLYQRKGEVLSTARRDEDALIVLEKALEMDREDWESYRLLMTVWSRTDMCAKATEEVEDYLERHPEHAKAYYARGFCHYKEKRWDEAFADVTRACELGHQPGCDMAEKRGRPAKVLSVERKSVPE